MYMSCVRVSVFSGALETISDTKVSAQGPGFPVVAEGPTPFESAALAFVVSACAPQPETRQSSASTAPTAIVVACETREQYSPVHSGHPPQRLGHLHCCSQPKRFELHHPWHTTTTKRYPSRHPIHTQIKCLYI